MYFSPYLAIGRAQGGGGVCQGIGTQPADAVFHPGQLKNQNFSNLIFLILRSHKNDHPSYVKHVLGRIHVFFTLFAIGCGGRGGQTRMVHNLLMLFFSLYSSKIQVSEAFFFLIPARLVGTCIRCTTQGHTGHPQGHSALPHLPSRRMMLRDMGYSSGRDSMSTKEQSQARKPSRIPANEASSPLGHRSQRPNACPQVQIPK